MALTNTISQYFNFDENLVRVEGTCEAPLFCVRDVCNVFGIVRISDVIRRLDDENLTQIKIKSGGQNRNAYFVNEKGLKLLLMKSRRQAPPEFLHFLKLKYNISLEVIIPYKESHWMSVILYAFADYESKVQYYIDGYLVDLMFVDMKIGVECDENGHSNYNSEKEVKRQRYIESEGYKLIRFNPDDEHFNIGRVIYQIRQLLIESE